MEPVSWTGGERQCTVCDRVTPRGSLIDYHADGCPIGTPTGRISWRDTFSVWPMLQISLHPLPWTWHWSWYSDDLERWWHLYAGPVTIQFGWNKGVFPLERLIKEG